MTRAETPLLLLTEPPARERPSTGAHTSDLIFLSAILVLVAGGSLHVLDQAAAHSSGRVAMSSQWADYLSHLSALWTPVLMQGAMKYSLLLLASIVNSALIVAMVYGLRGIDSHVVRPRHVTRLSLRLSKESGSAESMNQRRPKGYTRQRAVVSAPVERAETQRFLISPFFK